ncbi:MAG: RICIN domain-containing protein [Clostridia bacterium]|nr:RICIN domain-containing protein [Clostridia bacterium]
MKKVTALVLTVSMLASFLPYSFLTLAADSESMEQYIIAKYEFEDASFGLNASLSDSSQSGYDATVAGGDLASVDGVFGNGVNLNGNGYIELPQALLSAMKECSAVTLNAFVKKNELKHQFLFSASSGHMSAKSDSLGIIDAFNYRYEAGGSDTVTTGKRTAVDTSFSALTAVLDFENSTATLYVDGVSVGSGTISVSFDTFSVMGIGVSPWEDGYYNGYIDNFTIFSKALTAEEVSSLAGKMTVTPVYRDTENSREYRGEAVSLYAGESHVFESFVKDSVSFYNYTAKNTADCTLVAEYTQDGAYDYVIECASEKNAAYAIADSLEIGGDCSADEITLPSSVPGYSTSTVTWTKEGNAEISGNTITFEKTDALQQVTLTAKIDYNGESCTKSFGFSIHANDSTPQKGERALDINGLGYIAQSGENLIDITAFDYTCSTYTGWSSGNASLSDNFSVKEGYDDCKGIFAASLSSSTAEGSINPYIPIPEHTGEETFIITFAAYGEAEATIQWSNAFLCDESKNNTGYVLGNYDGTNCTYGIKVSPSWSVNSFAFTPKASDKYIRLCIGWASNIGIDNISIVKAEKLNVEINERYVTNKTAYDAEPLVLANNQKTATLQYGLQYVSDKAPESITYEGERYILVTDVTEKYITKDMGEESGSIVFDYRYVKESEMFIHPGVLNTEADLQFIAQKVAAGEEPYLSAYNALCENSYAQFGTNRATATIVRGGTGQNYAQLYQDVHRAYLCAIRWKISGDTAYADCARDILNAWSKTLKTVTGNADRYLAAGLYGYELVAAAEIMRNYEGFELERMQDMLMNVFYKPLTERFLYGNEYGGDHNGAHIMNYWANWDLCNMAFATALGVFCDRRDIYERAQEYYKYGTGNGSIFNAIPKLYEASESALNIPTGQWQEAGRDFGHTEMGVGLMAVVCEISWNQGDDLYSWAESRFMYGAEYVAQYEMNYEVPFTTYNWYSGTNGTWSSQTVISARGSLRPVWEMIYNHYAIRKGYDVPGIKAAAEALRPEGGAGGHASSFDQFGFGTLLYTNAGLNTKAKLPESNVKEGIYRITNRGTGSALTVNDEGYVKQYAVNEEDTAQQWELDDIGGGIYILTNVKTGKVMSVENDSYSNGALINTSDYTGKFSQQFALLSFEDEMDNYYDGYYRIAPVGSGLSIDVLNGKSDDGTDILQYTYEGAATNQQWELHAIDTSFVKVNVTVPEGEEEAVVYVATYDKKGIIIDLIKEVLDLSGGTRDFSFKANCNSEAGEYVRTFIWDDGMKPIN